MRPFDSSSNSSDDDDDVTHRHLYKRRKKKTQADPTLSQKVFISKSFVLLRILAAEDSSTSEDENLQDFGTSSWESWNNNDSDEQAEVEVQQPQRKVQPPIRMVQHQPVLGNGLTISDPLVLDCPICFDPFTIPVYQCEKGHLTCGSCCNKINNKCPRCSMQIGYNRCRGMEMVLESVKTPCQNVQRGCLEKISYSKKLEHEKTCKYASIVCPLPGCKFIDVLDSFYYHFTKNHSYSSFPITFNTATYLSVGKDVKQFLLIESDEKVFFIFNRVIDPLGSFVNVICIAPTLSRMKFSYDLTAKYGEKSVVLKSSVELTTQPSPQPAKEKWLLIRNEFHEFRNGRKTLFLKLFMRKVP